MIKYWICSLALLAACGGADLAEPVQPAADTAVISSIPVEPGVSLELAKARAQDISNLNYAIDFRIPADPALPIAASGIITFDLAVVRGDLQLDFREAGDKLKTLSVNDTTQAILHDAEHLIIPAQALKSGPNEITIGFEAGSTSLNRNPDYVYTLFVPDRARTVFPVFDQPNLKATYDLVLNLPESWAALGNAPLESVETSPDDPGRRIHTFARSDKLSTYLFSFVAGEFETVTRTVDGREMTMLHRETDSEKVARNVDDIFKAHGDALAWMENYTGIDYPFQKFDFALIPTFQYGGMEHVGAIQYRAGGLFLDEDPSEAQLLGRANLIAHETAHMWFGDLVTMDWFNDVWTKEVFANFMAAKIVNPSFPEIDHDLNFLLRSYPAAYAVDRSSGANPIRQPLPNLNEAGSLYGGIIYNKAPIMMKQLELLLGEDVFRDGLREYLARYAGGNATWPELIDIFDARSDQDLKAWSEVWVNTPGRPTFLKMFDTETEIMTLRQNDSAGDNRLWPQRLKVHWLPGGDVRPDTFDMNFTERSKYIPISARKEEMLFLYNSDGEGYGLFPVDLALTERVWETLTDLQKGAQLINLYEQMLDGNDDVSPQAYMNFLTVRIDEPNELLLNTILGQMRRTYWSFLSDAERSKRGWATERLLVENLKDANIEASTRKIYLRTLQDIASSDAALERLTHIWDGTEPIQGIPLSSRERSNLVALLAIKAPQQADDILKAHLASIENPDERRRFEFLMPSLSPEQSVRDAFFASLADAEARAIESWVLDALGYLHRPERLATSQAYIEESLELMEEIQVTGDIFFPAGWIGSTLSNHRSPEAAEIVRTFLAERPDYNYQLKLKILQAADMLYRAEAAQEKNQ